MAQATAKQKKRKYLKILDKAIVIVGAVVFALSMIRKILNYKNKSK